MAHMPAKRLAVYLAAGLVVLAVGGVGMMSLRGGGSPAEVVEVGSGSASTSIGAGGPAGSLATGGTTTTSSAPTSTTTTSPQVYVQVAGAVHRPGVYQVPADARVFQVLLQAGGVTAEADQEALPLAALVFDGCKIDVPLKGQPHGAVLVTGDSFGAGANAGGATPGGGGSVGAGGGSAGGTGQAKVSLNSATLAQLDTLPGVGPKTAQAILDYRQQNGPFTSVDQLTDVKGIGPAKLAQLRPLVTL